MSHVAVVDGLTLPARVGGHPALDFCNTWAGWNGGPTSEYLVGYEHLATWSAFAGLLSPARANALRRARQARAATAALSRARDFRGALYEVLLAGPRSKAFHRVASEAQLAASMLRLSGSGGQIELDFAESCGLDAPLLAVAWSAAQLLSSGERGLVRACPGSGCGWLFLDRRGRRRWCIMATCGNRAKVRRFSERQREARRSQR